MNLYQWRGQHRNFGDELNSLMWPRLLPDFFDQDEDTVFLGIGSILDGRHDPGAAKIVAGAGYGGYEARAQLDGNWFVHWVRGRRTARSLNLPATMGLGDPASLLPLAGLAPPREDRLIGFMPHFESLDRGAWRDVAEAAGVTLIDPRDDPMTVLAAIGQCRVVLSEALHGIIVADALRVPWIAIQPLAPIHRAKWFDWAETLDLTIDFHTPRPSTALERFHLTPLARTHTGRTLLTRHAERLRRLARSYFIDRSAEALHRIAQAEPRLSPGARLDEAQSRMLETIEALRRMPTFGRERTARPVQPPTAKPLHPEPLSAYLASPGRSST